MFQPSQSGCFKPKIAFEDSLIRRFTCAIKKKKPPRPRNDCESNYKCQIFGITVLIPKHAEKRAGLTAAEPLIFRSANRLDRQLMKFTGKSEYQLIKTPT